MDIYGTWKLGMEVMNLPYLIFMLRTNKMHLILLLIIVNNKDGMDYSGMMTKKLQNMKMISLPQEIVGIT